PIPKPENRRFTPKLYFKNNPILKFLGDLHIKELWTSVSNFNKNNSVPFWLKLAEKGLNGAFESKSIFKGLCEIMIQIAQCKDHSKGIQNLKYSENITHFMAVLSSLSPKALLRQKSGEYMSDTSICLENMAHFKRLADSINYDRPVIAMTDNIKVYSRLGYSANFGCIIGSIFSLDQTLINDYNETESVIQSIISNNAIAKQVRLYLLQIPLPKFLPVVIGLIPNNRNETSARILKIHEKVLEIAQQLSIHIVSIGADGAISEFNAQKHLMSKNTRLTKSFHDLIYNINFICSVFPGVGPVIRVLDLLHAQKSARNALFSGVRLLTLGNYIAMYDQVLDMCKQDDSILYKKDVINCDRQDDGASYHLFYSSLLNQVMNSNISNDICCGLFVYLFVI
ncbi:22440_t:CDS:2, partial [Racocetra persica]